LAEMMKIPNVVDILQNGLASGAEIASVANEPKEPEIKKIKSKVKKEVKKEEISVKEDSFQVEKIKFQGEEQVVDAHKKKIKCVALNPKFSNFLASLSLDGYVKLWDIKFSG
jgi:WD40 repeat protein